MRPDLAADGHATTAGRPGELRRFPGFAGQAGGRLRQFTMGLACQSGSHREFD